MYFIFPVFTLCLLQCAEAAAAANTHDTRGTRAGPAAVCRGDSSDGGPRSSSLSSSDSGGGAEDGNGAVAPGMTLSGTKNRWSL